MVASSHDLLLVQQARLHIALQQRMDLELVASSAAVRCRCRVVVDRAHGVNVPAFESNALVAELGLGALLVLGITRETSFGVGAAWEIDG